MVDEPAGPRGGRGVRNEDQPRRIGLGDRVAPGASVGVEDDLRTCGSDRRARERLVGLRVSDLEHDLGAAGDGLDRLGREREDRVQHRGSHQRQLDRLDLDALGQPQHGRPGILRRVSRRDEHERARDEPLEGHRPAPGPGAFTRASSASLTLQRGAARVGRGDLEVVPLVPRHDEIGGCSAPPSPVPAPPSELVPPLPSGPPRAREARTGAAPDGRAILVVRARYGSEEETCDEGDPEHGRSLSRGGAERQFREDSDRAVSFLWAKAAAPTSAMPIHWDVLRPKKNASIVGAEGLDHEAERRVTDDEPRRRPDRHNAYARGGRASTAAPRASDAADS